MTKNPFRFGRPAGEGPLVGRKRELEELRNAFHEGRNLTLVAPRGSGKSALFHEARKRAAAEGLQCIHVDLFPAISGRRFAELYASALTMGPASTVESMQEAVQQLVPTIVPRVTITGDGRPGLQLDLWDRDRDLRVLLERILDAPEQMAVAAEQPVIVIFDDFEELIASVEPELLKQLAQAIRKHRHVSYCFALRRESTAQATFSKPTSPFYRLADAVALGPVPEAEMIEGLGKIFADEEIEADPALLAELIQRANNVPHSVQLLAHAIFDVARDLGTANEQHLRAGLNHILDASGYAYKAQWDHLSVHQRNLVLAIAQGYTERLHSQRMVFQLGLGSPSTVSKNLRAMIDREILEKREKSILFVDPFFGLWLRRRLT
jgi:AAA+ ATPase superfamily predicted ATPase